MKYQHVIWDWNGTLLDDTWLCYELSNNECKKRGHPGVDFEHYHKHSGHPFINYFRSLGIPLTEEEYQTLTHDFHHGYEARRHETALHHDAEAALKFIKDLGAAQTIISAHPHEMLNEIVSHFGILHYFAAALGKREILAQGKLDVAAEWIEKSKFDPKEIVLIGDTAHDFEVASHIGVDCILIPNGNEHKERLEKHGAPMAASLSEAVKKIVER